MELDMSEKICDSEDGFACPMDLLSIFGKLDAEIKYDLYQCKKCGMLMKYNITEEGIDSRTVIKPDNTLIKDIDNE
jgi:hypothetical protein